MCVCLGRGGGRGGPVPHPELPRPPDSQVKFLEGLLMFVVVAVALCTIFACMHAIDTPTRFSQPEGSQRQHQD